MDTLVLMVVLYIAFLSVCALASVIGGIRQNLETN